MENKYWRQAQENLIIYYQTVLKEIKKEILLIVMKYVRR